MFEVLIISTLLQLKPIPNCLLDYSASKKDFAMQFILIWMIQLPEKLYISRQKEVVMKNTKK